MNSTANTSTDPQYSADYEPILAPITVTADAPFYLTKNFWFGIAAGSALVWFLSQKNLFVEKE